MKKRNLFEKFDPNVQRYTAREIDMSGRGQECAFFTTVKKNIHSVEFLLFGRISFTLELRIALTYAHTNELIICRQ